MSCRCKNECPCCDCRRKPCLRKQLADANNAILSAANILLNYIDAYDLDDDEEDCNCNCSYDDDDNDYSCDDDDDDYSCDCQCCGTSQSNQQSSCSQKSSCSRQSSNNQHSSCNQKSKCSCENYYDNTTKYNGCCSKKSSCCGCWGRA